MKTWPLVAVFLAVSALRAPQEPLNQEGGILSEPLPSGIPITCSQGQMLTLPDKTPVSNAKLKVRRIKQSWPYRGLTVIRIEPGKVVRETKTNSEGHFNLAKVRPGKYFLQLFVPTGEAWGVVEMPDKVAGQSCVQVFVVQQVTDGMVIKSPDT